MNKEEFLKEKEMLLSCIENNTSEHWKNYYKDVPIKCIFDDLVIDINEIKRLQDKVNQLEKELIKKTKRCTERNHRIRCRDRKLERRNKKINKLETNIDKAIKYVKSLDYDDYGTGYYDIAENHYDELLSLLESGKE